MNLGKTKKALPRNNLVPYIPIVFGLEFRFYWWVPDANGVVTVDALQDCEGDGYHQKLSEWENTFNF